jgi:exodeoxyribonuclease VII large subunit
VAEIARRLDRAGAAAPGTARDRLSRAARLLETLGYRATLARGYAVVRAAADGATLTGAAAVTPGLALEIEFADGRAAATGATGAGEPAAKPRRPRRAAAQGSLF